MDKTQIAINILGRRITSIIPYKEIGVKGDNETTEFVCTFSGEEWTNATKYIVIKKPDNVVMLPIALVNNKVTIPAFALTVAGMLEFSFTGTDVATDQEIYTYTKEIPVGDSLNPSGGIVSEDYENMFTDVITATGNAITATQESNIQTGLCETATAAAEDITATVHGKLDNGDFVGAQGYTPQKGVDYFDGLPGIKGDPGPNSVSTSTTTNISGMLTGNGINVSEEKRVLNYNTVKPFPAIRDELTYRATSIAIIDDFSSPTGWTGNADIIALTGEAARSNISTGSNVYVEKDYISALQIKQYIAFPVDVSAVVDMALLAVFAYSGGSYFSITVNNFVSKYPTVDGVSFIIINKNEFSVGVGTPSWTAINKLRITFKSATGKSITVKVGKIQTYDMRGLCTVWFDDAEITQYTEAFTRMNALAVPMQGVISVPADLVGSSASYFTKKQLCEMKNCGWEFVNHTKSHKNLTTITLTEAEYQIEKGMDYLLGIGAGKGAFHFVPPNAGRSPAIDTVIKKYAISERYRSDSYNCTPTTNPYLIAVQQVINTTTVATIQGWIDTAAANGLWLVLLFHYIVTPASSSTQYTPANFQTIINYLSASTLKTLTVSDVLSLS